MIRWTRAAMLALLILPALASAHAALVGTAPEAKSSLKASPQQIVLTFTENVAPVFVKVLDQAGREAGAPGEIQPDGNDLRLPLRKPLGNGTYLVTYRVISADTHAVGGSFVFAVGEPVAAAQGLALETRAPRRSWSIAVALNRFVQYASVLLALGSAIILVWMRLPETAAGVAFHQGLVASAIAAIGCVVAFGFGGVDMIAGGAASLLSPASWSMAAKSTLLPSAVLGVPGALLLAWAFRRRRTGWTLWVGGALVLASLLVTGHAATAAPVWLMAANVALHLTCASFWFGALVPLRVAVRSVDGSDAGDVLAQFSLRAVWTVIALLLSGVVVSFVQVRTLGQLLATDYGLRLAIKLSLFALLLALAVLNKAVLTPAVVRSEAAGVRRLSASLRAEYGLMLAIVLAAASLTVVTPPRSLLAQSDAGGSRSGAAAAGMADSGFHTSVERGGYRFDVEVTPARPGENRIMVTFRDAHGKPVDMVTSRLTLSLPAASIESADVEGRPMPLGMYHFVANQMIIPGTWTMRIEGFVNDFDKVVAEVSVPVR